MPFSRFVVTLWCAKQGNKPTKHLAHTQQLHLKNEGRPAWYSFLPLLAIAHIGRQIQLPFIAHMHLLQGNYPALNQLAQTASQWHTTQTRVELAAVDGSPRVVNRYDALRRRTCAARFALLYHLIHYALSQAFHPRLFCFFFKPAFVGFHVCTFCHVVLGLFMGLWWCVKNRCVGLKTSRCAPLFSN